MPQNARVTIAGLPIAGGQFGDHSWPFKRGLTAPLVTWRLPLGVAGAVLALKETTIEMEAPGRETFKIERVVVVREDPSDNPLERCVVLSDVRWYWPRVHVRKLYNLRTYAGTRTLQQVTGVPNIILPQEYAPSFLAPTLRGDQQDATGTPWKGKEIMEDVMKAVTSFYGGKFTDLSRSRPSLVPNDIRIDSRGDQAIAQALARIGGVDVRIAPDSTAEIVNAYLGAEIPILLKAVPYSLFEKGHLRFISMGNVAPPQINVYYEREVEVRADGHEIESNTQSSFDANNDEPYLENVITVSDLRLPVPGPAGSSRQAIQGEVLEVDEWLNAVDSVGDRINTLANSAGPMTREVACNLWFGPMLETQYVTWENIEPDPVWAARMAAFRRDYRTLWRLNPRFSRRILPGSIRAIRAALINPATGLRAKSVVYQDYARRPSIRGMRAERQSGYNQNCIPGDPMTQNPGRFKIYDDPDFPFEVFPLSRGKIGPFELDVEDSVIGLFRVEPKKDPEGQTADYSPGLVQELVGVSPQDAFLYHKPATWETARLIYTHRVAFIFSCVPLGPNGTEAALHRYEIPAAKALAALGVKPDAVTPGGPVYELRVMPALARARCAWGDEIRSQILSCFVKIGNNEIGSGGQSLVPVNDAELEEYATVSASVLMSAMLDHIEGSAAIEFTPWLSPIGAMESVVHTVDANGVFYTIVNCHPIVPTLQPENLLSPGSRAILMGWLGQTP